jgi:hypothetical protein
MANGRVRAAEEGRRGGQVRRSLTEPKRQARGGRGSVFGSASLSAALAVWRRMAAATSTTHPRQVTSTPAHAHAHAARCEGDREPWPVARRAIRRVEGPRDEKDSPSGGACNRGPTPPLVLVLLTLMGGCAGGCSAAARPLLPWLLTALHWPLTATNHRVLPRGGPPAVCLSVWSGCLPACLWPLISGLSDLSDL